MSARSPVHSKREWNKNPRSWTRSISLALLSGVKDNEISNRETARLISRMFSSSFDKQKDDDLFLLVPLISFLLRMRRKKRLLDLSRAAQMTASASVAASHADLVRKRLQTAGSGVKVPFLEGHGVKLYVLLGIQ